jgi:hypothetical protein
MNSASNRDKNGNLKDQHGQRRPRVCDPLFNKFAKIDLTPHTIEVLVESAIAAGIVL